MTKNIIILVLLAVIVMSFSNRQFDIREYQLDNDTKIIYEFNDDGMLKSINSKNKSDETGNYYSYQTLEFNDKGNLSKFMLTRSTKIDKDGNVVYDMQTLHLDSTGYVSHYTFTRDFEILEYKSYDSRKGKFVNSK